MLKSSRVAGIPESYFRKQDQLKLAQTWGIADKSQQSFSFSDFIDAAISAGKTPNNIFATRIMWGTMKELTTNLAAIHHTTGDKNLLEMAFGETKFIYLKREDLIAQAISRLRAEQTDIWHQYEGSGYSPPDIRLKYDFQRIKDFIREADEHNTMWNKWFAENNISPYVVTYENLADYPEKTTHDILGFLNISLPKEIQLSAKNKRLSDDISATWMKRYHEDCHQNS